MKSGMSKMALRALMLGLVASSAMNPNMYGTPRIDNSKPYPIPKDLPLWDVGGHKIYAKNEKDAIKYAKKRGLWKDGMEVKLLEK